MNGLAAAAWPWLAMAAAGALHGLHPASGWPLLVACGVHQRRPWWCGLPLLALGHLVAMAWVAAAAWRGLSASPWLAGGVLLVVGAAWWGRRGARARSSAAVRAIGLVAGGCSLAMLQGTGLMLVPALGLLCGREGAAAAPLLSALAAAALHLAAMLAVSALVAQGVARAGASGAACRARVMAALAWCTKAASASGREARSSCDRPR